MDATRAEHLSTLSSTFHRSLQAIQHSLLHHVQQCSGIATAEHNANNYADFAALTLQSQQTELLLKQLDSMQQVMNDAQTAGSTLNTNSLLASTHSAIPAHTAHSAIAIKSET